MKINPLPFLISIPHGGTLTPVEIKDQVIIDKKDLFDDSDAFTNEIYDVGKLVIKIIKTNIARAFVDLSRSPQQMPPEFPDGLIKSSTCFRKPIYAPNKHPNPYLRKILIQYYYKPYHHEIRTAVNSSAIKLGLDCHSMLPTGPAISPDAGQPRPLINPGNRDGQSCSNEIANKLAQSFSEVFQFPEEEVTLNRPFKGGYITQMYGQNPIPWIQIEMNRALYLSPPWFDTVTRHIDPHRLPELNRLFAETLIRFNQLL
jgi:N-formylglutamate deformylase